MSGRGGGGKNNNGGRGKGVSSPTVSPSLISSGGPQTLQQQVSQTSQSSAPLATQSSLAVSTEADAKGTIDPLAHQNALSTPTRTSSPSQMSRLTSILGSSLASFGRGSQSALSSMTRKLTPDKSKLQTNSPAPGIHSNPIRLSSDLFGFDNVHPETASSGVDPPFVSNPMTPSLLSQVPSNLTMVHDGVENNLSDSTTASLTSAVQRLTEHSLVLDKQMSDARSNAQLLNTEQSVLLDTQLEKFANQLKSISDANEDRVRAQSMTVMKRNDDNNTALRKEFTEQLNMQKLALERQVASVFSNLNAKLDSQSSHFATGFNDMKQSLGTDMKKLLDTTNANAQLNQQSIVALIRAEIAAAGSATATSTPVTTSDTTATTSTTTSTSPPMTSTTTTTTTSTTTTGTTTTTPAVSSQQSFGDLGVSYFGSQFAFRGLNPYASSPYASFGSNLAGGGPGMYSTPGAPSRRIIGGILQSSASSSDGDSKGAMHVSTAPPTMSPTGLPFATAPPVPPSGDGEATFNRGGGRRPIQQPPGDGGPPDGSGVDGTAARRTMIPAQPSILIEDFHKKITLTDLRASSVLYFLDENWRKGRIQVSTVPMVARLTKNVEILLVGCVMRNTQLFGPYQYVGGLNQQLICENAGLIVLLYHYIQPTSVLDFIAKMSTLNIVLYSEPGDPQEINIIRSTEIAIAEFVAMCEMLSTNTPDNYIPAVSLTSRPFGLIQLFFYLVRKIDPAECMKKFYSCDVSESERKEMKNILAFAHSLSLCLRRQETIIRQHQQTTRAMSLSQSRNIILQNDHNNNHNNNNNKHNIIDQYQRHPANIDRTPQRQPHQQPQRQSQRQSGASFRAISGLEELPEDLDLNDLAFYDPDDDAFYPASVADLYEEGAEEAEEDMDMDGGGMFSAMMQKKKILPGPKKSVKEMACFRELQEPGGCPNGDKCRFSHDPVILSKACESQLQKLLKSKYRHKSQDVRTFRSMIPEQDGSGDSKENC